MRKAEVTVTPACPMAQALAMEVKNRLQLENVSDERESFLTFRKLRDRRSLRNLVWHYNSL